MIHNIRKKVRPEIKEYAKQLRKTPTSSEKYLWKFLHNRKLGIRFRRQTVIRGFIVDFYCPSKQLIIELDGSSHIGKEEYDKRRQEILENLGCTVLRFSNKEVLLNSEYVISKILAFL